MTPCGPRSCICYTSDINYALPTLLSAAQAARHHESTDVIIVFYGIDAGNRTALSAICLEHGIKCIFIGAGDVDMPSMMYLRLYLDQILPSDYVNILHVDGDTQITGSLDPVLSYAAPDDKILAAPDLMALMFDKRYPFAPSWNRYFDRIGLGLRQRARYVNTGLFRVHRSALGAIRRECEDFEKRSVSALIFGQQDALNVCFGDAICLISLRWNFPALLLPYGFVDADEIRVLHFMSNPRPWDGHFYPWTTHHTSVYREFADRHPELRALVTRRSDAWTWRYRLQQAAKRVAEAPLWRHPTLKRRHEMLESQAHV